MNVLITQLGARQDYTVPLAVQRLGSLEHLYTDIFLSPLETKVLTLAKKTFNLGRAFDSLLSRQNKMIDFVRVTRFISMGLQYRKALQSAQSTQMQYRAYIDFGCEFNRLILSQGLRDASHLYAFDHAALDLFRVAKTKGILCVLDQIYAGPAHEEIAAEEEDLAPDWGISTYSDFCRSGTFKEWCDIQAEEWQLADKIIVASQYAKQSILSVDSTITNKIVQVPLTVNLEAYWPFQYVREYTAHRPLRVLYVGRVSALKGIHYLLKAFTEIPTSIASLKIVGAIQIPDKKVLEYQDVATFCGPVPHYQIPINYHEADVLVFPSISDGFGAVMLEAMATGLPVISTDNCGDIVQNGNNGYRIPIRSTSAIIEKITELGQQPDTLSKLSRGAITTSQQYTLDHYQTKLQEAFISY